LSLIAKPLAAQFFCNRSTDPSIQRA
jgi:hypothetical protein